jgi:hypothetical protein
MLLYLVLPLFSYFLHTCLQFFSENLFQNFGHHIDLTNWGKLGFHCGFGGNQRTVVQLFGQLDGAKLHSRRKAPLSSLVQPLLH